MRGTHAALVGTPKVPLCNVPDGLISNLHNLVARIPPACKRSHRFLASCPTQGSIGLFPRNPRSIMRHGKSQHTCFSAATGPGAGPSRFFLAESHLRTDYLLALADIHDIPALWQATDRQQSTLRGTNPRAR